MILLSTLVPLNILPKQLIDQYYNGYKVLNLDLIVNTYSDECFSFSDALTGRLFKNLNYLRDRRGLTIIPTDESNNIHSIITKLQLSSNTSSSTLNPVYSLIKVQDVFIYKSVNSRKSLFIIICSI